MSDDELRALYEQLSAAPDVPADATMSSKRRTPMPGDMNLGDFGPPGKRRKAGSTTIYSEGRMTPLVEREARKTLRNFRKLNVFAERQNARLLKSSREAKRRDVESFCEQLVRAERATPAQVATVIKPLLLKCDDTLPVYRFSENGVTRKLTEYEQKKAELLRGPKVIHFGERLGGPGAAVAGEVETQKVQRFAEVQAAALKAAGYKTPTQFVEKFGEARKKNPELTAAGFIGPEADKYA